MEDHGESLTIYELGDLEEILGTRAVVCLNDTVLFPEPKALELFRFFPNGISDDASCPSVTLRQFRGKLIASVLIPDTGLTKHTTATILGDRATVAQLHSRFNTFAFYHSEDYSNDVDIEIELLNGDELHANIFCEPTATYGKLIEDFRLLVKLVDAAPGYFKAE